MSANSSFYAYDHLTPTSTVFVRYQYVANTNTLVNDEAEAKATLIYLSTKRPSITFDLARPKENGYLPTLAIKLKINVDGTLSRQHYTKPACCVLILHSKSYHPSTTKKALVLSELCSAIH